MKFLFAALLLSSMATHVIASPLLYFGQIGDLVIQNGDGEPQQVQAANTNGSFSLIDISPAYTSADSSHTLNHTLTATDESISLTASASIDVRSNNQGLALGYSDLGFSFQTDVSLRFTYSGSVALEVDSINADGAKAYMFMDYKPDFNSTATTEQVWIIGGGYNSRNSLPIYPETPRMGSGEKLLGPGYYELHFLAIASTRNVSTDQIEKASYTTQIDFTTVPEPSTMLLGFIGITGLLLRRSRK